MNNLRKLRTEKNLTQTELAKIIGIKQNTLSYWERGVCDIDNTALKQLAKYFNCTTDYILGEKEEKQKPTDIGEPLRENVVIFHRDGKTVTKEFTQEQMEIITKLLDEIPEKPKNV